MLEEGIQLGSGPPIRRISRGGQVFMESWKITMGFESGDEIEGLRGLEQMVR
jgi:hypothetical protein